MVDTMTVGRENPYARLRAPGQIQGFGVMLTLHPTTLRVLNASDNVLSIFGIEHRDILGCAIFDVIDQGDIASEIKIACTHIPPNFSNPVPVVIHGQRFDLIMHAHDGLIFAEFEKLAVGAPTRVDMDRLSDNAIMGMMMPSSFAELLTLAPHAIRNATNFDRVLLYKFDDTFRGEVVSESCRPDVESFMGMFFPESDIGGPARELYTENFCRYIPQIGAVTSRMEPPDNSLTTRRLDMSHAVLRAVAPCHVEYLANMGVTASMSFSIISEGRLWGLFACHHYGISQLSYTQRLICEQIAMMFVAKLEELANPETVARDMSERLADALITLPLFAKNPLTNEWTAAQEQRLLDVVNAEGASIYIDGKVGTIGNCPDLTALHTYIEGDPSGFNRLMQMYDEKGLFYTSSIASVLPCGSAMREQGSGFMVVPLSRTRREYLLWFRPELVVKATWAGDPSVTKIKDLNARMSPRRSFEAWKEDIRDRSEPWTALEISNGAALRDHALAHES